MHCYVAGMRNSNKQVNKLEGWQSVVSVETVFTPGSEPDKVRADTRGTESGQSVAPKVLDLV